MTNLILLFYFLVFLLTAIGLGSDLLALFKFKANNTTEKVALSFAAGTILQSYFFHLLGEAKLLYPQILIGGYFLGFLYYLVKHRRGILGLISQRTVKTLENQFKNINEIDLIGSIGLVLILFPLIPHLFLYPTGWDVLAYHLALPKFYLTQHWFPFTWWFDQTGFPIGIEAIYGFGVALTEPRLANLIHFSFIIVALSYLGYGLNYIVTRKAKWLAIFIFIMQPMLFSEVSISAYVDYPLTFFALVIMILTINYLKQKDISSFILLCYFVGFVPLVKFSGILLAVSTSFVVMIELAPKIALNKWRLVDQIRSIQLSSWILIGLCFSQALYWYLRNAYFTHNPFYPFFNHFFRGFGYRPEAKSVLKDDILLLNSFLTQTIKNFISTTDTAQDYANLATIGLLIAGFIAIFWFIKTKNTALRIIAHYAGVNLLFLLVLIGPLTRYIFYVFPILGILVGELLFSKINKKAFTLQALKIFFTLTIILTIFVQIDSFFVQRNKLFLSLPKRGWLSYLNQSTAYAMLNEYDIFKVQSYLNEHLSPTDKVLQLLDNRIYYLDVPNAFASPVTGGYFTDSTITTAKDVCHRISSDGFTHLLKYVAWGPHPVMNAEVFNGLIQEYAQPVATVSGISLYTLNQEECL